MQLFLLTDFDLFSLVCINLILILCKMIDFFIKVTKVKSIMINYSIFNEI